MSTLKERIAREFSTPCVVIDMDRVERNIARTQALCAAAGVNNRPHIKTHKSPVLATMQIEAGASGITCQKIGEAEVMADGGVDNILIAYNLLGEEKMGRLGRLLGRADVTVAADNLTVIEGLPRAGEIAGRPLGVVIECDTGRKRAGVETAAEAIALAREVAKRPGLEFRGLMFYPTETSWRETQVFFDTVKEALRPDGLADRMTIVSTGGTPNLANLGKLDGATEHRAGTSIFNDRMMLKAGAATLDDCALSVYATVVSRAGPERGILDSGSKTLTSDSGGLDGYGLILEHPQARIAGFSEEHGNLDLTGVNDKPKVGDIVRVIPNHVCVVVNMVDRLVMVRGEDIVGELPVAARGRLT
ncbi:MAG: alanine racemase [Rhizobiales bacterium 65-9]|nr:D-TA family PLP-dependent enzyme [Hyphomicrobiales bacterium]OJY38126.1 MAG: alanine racemase [Rhizobiales bacterium 65-9]